MSVSMTEQMDVGGAVIMNTDVTVLDTLYA
jgi:hypothetical protein